MNDVDFFLFFYRAAERRGILETLPRNSGNFAAEFRGPRLSACVLNENSAIGLQIGFQGYKIPNNFSRFLISVDF